MRDLAAAIPDVETLVSIEPQELGAKLLLILRKRNDNQVNLGNLLGELYIPGPNGAPPYSRTGADIEGALTEAWSWLESQGLLVPSSGTNGHNGWRRLSRRAKRYEDETEFARLETVRLLPKDRLHPRIADRVWSAFIRGEYDVAAFQAMKGVEVYVREIGGYGNELIGIKLMQEAFKPEGGRLTDMTAEAGERVGRMQLFCGAIGSYKNPNSHRDVDLSDPQEALEIVFLANHLLRIVDARALDLGKDRK